MLTRTRGLLLFGSLLLLSVVLASWHATWAEGGVAAGTYPVPDRYGLRGLRGFYVQVDSLPYEVEEKGLTQQGLQREVELQLRKGGALVLTGEQARDNPNAPRLHVRIPASKTDHQSLINYAIVVSFAQPAVLSRDSSIAVDAITWSKAGSGLVKSKKVDQIRKHACEIVDEFLNAYLAENPRP
jgi:hypothetical protein